MGVLSFPFPDREEAAGVREAVPRRKGRSEATVEGEGEGEIRISGTPKIVLLAVGVCEGVDRDVVVPISTVEDGEECGPGVVVAVVVSVDVTRPVSVESKEEGEREMEAEMDLVGMAERVERML